MSDSESQTYQWEDPPERSWVYVGAFFAPLVIIALGVYLLMPIAEFFQYQHLPAQIVVLAFVMFWVSRMGHLAVGKPPES